MEELIRSLARKHGLLNADVIAITERVFSEMLGRFYGYPVGVMFTDESDLRAVVYRKLSDGKTLPVEVRPEILRRLDKGKTPKALERALKDMGDTVEMQRLKPLLHRVIWGEIQKRVGGNLIVEFRFDGETLIGTCPLRNVGPHERWDLGPGQRRAFHVRYVTPARMVDVIRQEIILDRVSKRLTTGLFADVLPGVKGIACHTRYVGNLSLVNCLTPIPKAAINAVKVELGGEHVRVRFGQTSGAKKDVFKRP